jgi:DNA-binding response OmpR family regulator
VWPPVASAPGVAGVVLIVEDEPELLYVMQRALVAQGFAVRSAFDCGKALAKLDNPPPDLICIDLCLPDQSGYELCEYVRRHPACAQVPVLVMGDAAFPEHMAYAEVAGANAFLKKPFRPEALVRCVESLVQGAPASTDSLHLLRQP